MTKSNTTFRIVLAFAAMASLPAQNLQTSIAEAIDCEWQHDSPYVIDAIRLHGEGKDDAALVSLQQGQNDVTKARYALGLKRYKSDFWKLVVRGKGLAANFVEARAQIVQQFSTDLQSLSRTSDAFQNKSDFTALFELLHRATAGAIPIYRGCFSVDPSALFKIVDEVLGPRS